MNVLHLIGQKIFCSRLVMSRPLSVDNGKILDTCLQVSTFMGSWLIVYLPRDSVLAYYSKGLCRKDAKATIQRWEPIIL